MSTDSTGSALAIRRMTGADLPTVNEIYNHWVKTSSVSFDLEPMTEKRRRAWFSDFDERGPHQAFVAVLAEVVVGFACSHPFRPKPAYRTSVETTIYLQPEARGRGVARPLYGRLFEALAVEDLHRAYAVIALPNAASVALHRRNGFTRVGVLSEAGRKFGRYWDLCLMERKLGQAPRP